MEQRKHLPVILASGLAGFITALAIVITLYQNELNSIMDWGIALSLLALGFGSIYFMSLPYAWKQFSEASRPVQFWAVALAVISAIFFSLEYGYLSFFAFLFAGFVLVSRGLSSFQELISQKRSWRFIFAWTLGGVISFFALGFLQDFHPSHWEFVLFTVLLNLVFTLFFEIALEWATEALQKDPKEKFISIAIAGLGILWIILVFRLLVQYPTLFPPDFFLPSPHLIPAFLGLTILSQSWAATILQKLDSSDWRISPFILWMKRNLPGLLLASAISASTYIFAVVFVSSDFSLADNYFDTDSPIWINFLTASADEVVSMRAVHPFVLMLLRPQVWLLSLLLNGDKFHAAILLNALVGGLCVFLTWLFFKQRTNNTAYALIIASLLGISNSHLLLSTFLESYIFSAAILITSVLLLQNENAKLTHIVPVGLVAFGITITNFIQTCIIFLLTQHNIKKTFKYVFITIALATVLTFTQTLLQPNSRAFYITANLTSEAPFRRDIIGMPFSEAVSLGNVMFRTFTLSSVVAPRPFITLDEGGCSNPCFYTIRYFRKTYQYQYASYIGFGSWLARAWFAMLFIAFLIFVRDLIKSPRKTSLQAALVLNLLFNFMLHMNYGDDPMLYSPNWTYALTFFFGISFEKFADKKWIQVVLLIFLTALLFNNIELFRKMLDAVLPVFG